MLKRLSAYVTALSLLAVFGVVSPSAAFERLYSEACGHPKKGELPVVLVHGFISSEKMWGEIDDPTKLRGALEKEVDNLHIETFDYSSYATGWVANNNIGLALARKIHCLSTRAWRATGNNWRTDPSVEPKVVIIGHSMGGLAARYASTLSVAEGQSTARDIDLLMTIGTPSLGSALPLILKSVSPTLSLGVTTASEAVCELMRLTTSGHFSFKDTEQCVSALSALNIKSSQLDELDLLNEWHLDNLPIFAVAGNMGVGVKLPWGVHDISLETDIAVDTLSATKRSHEINGVGGKYIQGCNGLIIEVSLARPFLKPAEESDVSCWHSGLPHHPEVRRRIIKQIKLYQTTRQNW